MPKHDQPDLRAYWGKAGRAKQDEETVPHPLICHTLDTAAVAELLYTSLLGPECRAQLSAAFAPLGGEPAAWVAFLCGLHDLGKLSPAFQAVRADVAAKHLAGTTAAVDVTELAEDRQAGGRTDTSHGLVTTHHVKRMLTAWGASGRTAQILAQVLGAHHGNFFDWTAVAEASEAQRDNGGAVWAARVDELVRRTAELLGLPDPATVPWSEVTLSPTAATALAGLTTASDWIASGLIDKNSHAGTEVDLPAYVLLARERARRQVVDQLGWSSWTPPADLSFHRLFARDPHPLQVAIDRMIASKDQPGILVVDAPTGEGKTWIALHAVLRLMRQLGLIGFYVGMPTRATSNQLFEEAEPVLQRLDSPLAVKLLHGTAADYLADRRGRIARAELIRPECVGVDDSDGPDDELVREWFTRNKALLSPAGVGTVDRLLQVGIRSRWAPLPLVGLSNRVVVVDEVHGYDVYMSTILDRVLWWLGSLGVPVILLSATLPRTRRQKLVNAWYAGATGGYSHAVELALPAASYPSALWVDRTGTAEVASAEASKTNRDRRIALTRLDDDDLVGWALRHAAGGAAICVIHNLVRRVTDTVDALHRAIALLPAAERPQVVEITGRLPDKERTEIEAELRRRFGRGGTRASKTGYIVVGTQVLEQSLDLDFDIMASDLAPIDSLIQRAGRLHRFRAVDPDDPPTLAIVGVTERRTGPDWPRHTTLIYQDLVLLRTWLQLADRDELVLPQDAPVLVDRVYPQDPGAGECPAGWRWDKARRAMARRFEDDAGKAAGIYLPPPCAEDALVDSTHHPRSTWQTRRNTGRGGRRV